jgi:hypothetical protein
MNAKSGDQQPEALRSLEAAAKSGSRKPEDQGLTATARTKPAPADLDREERTAAEVLEAGVRKDPKGMEEAAKKAPKG